MTSRRILQPKATKQFKLSKNLLISSFYIKKSFKFRKERATQKQIFWLGKLLHERISEF